MLPPAYVEELVATGREGGLDVVGITSAEPLDRARVALEQRKDAGLHAGMQFTYRNPARSTEPQQTLSSARSIVVAARAYPAGDAVSSGSRHARVAWYAATDHYASLRAGLDLIADRLRADGWKAIVLADDNALVDREVAHRAGLGWFGKNANLLVPGHGSWFVLGSVLTDAELPVAAEPEPDGCAACTRCLDGCPTSAIVAPGVIDANRCLAWLVQAEGVFPRQFRVALGDRLYGCDECQSVCPVNRRHGSRRPSASECEGANVDVVELLRSDDDELLATFGRWYIPRREPRYLRRNALIVLGNIGEPRDPDVVDVVRHHLASDDAMLRAHAVWTARRLGLGSLVADAADGLAEDELVRSELVAPVQARR